MLAVSLLLTVFAQKPLVDLPFELVGNRIYLPATLNGRNTPAILDTGAGASAVDLALADELKIPGDQRIQAGGVGETAVYGRIVKGANILVGDQPHSVNYAIPFSPLNGAEGRKLELILGYDLISRFVFQVDYAAKRTRIHSAGSFLPGSGTEIPIQIKNGHPHIRAKVTIGGETHEVDAMIDSGASGTGLTGRFVKSHPIPASVPSTASTTIGGGVGGFVKGRFLRLDSIEVAGNAVKLPVVSVNESGGGANGANAAYDVLLGADFLKQFTLTIDYGKKRVFLSPNANFGKPSPVDLSGIRLISSGPNLRTYSVTGILPGSTSDKAGLQTGDKLISIDGIASDSKSLQEWRDYLRTPTAKPWDIKVDRKGETVHLKIEAKPVI